MKKKIILGLIALILVTSGYGQTKTGDNIPLAPKQYRRPKNWQPANYKYTLKDLKDKFSGDLMQRASVRREHINRVNKEGKWKPTSESINSHAVPEWFEDAKFGMFIDWGLWSIAGWAPKPDKNASPLEKNRIYPDWYENNLYHVFKDYHEKNWGSDFKRDDFIPLFKAETYQPDKLVEIAVESGMKYIVPFSKHCTGFCLWPSSFTQRDVGDMGPRKDLIRPLVESCKQKGLKFGFYLCQEEWEYPVIDEEKNLKIRTWGGKLKPYSAEYEKKCSGKIPVKNYGSDYLLPLATEFIEMYDPDILWFDAEWSTTLDKIPSYDITSYFYNNAEGRKEVAVNDRFASKDWATGRWKTGDFFTDESQDMINEMKDKPHAWEECRGISISYGFNWEDGEENLMSSESFLKMFLDIVSKGGNLLLITNLDGQGTIPDIMMTRLKDIGHWLKVNGEGIYATRAYTTHSDTTFSKDPVFFTRSKDFRKVYAISTAWPGKQFKFRKVIPKEGSKINMLGVKRPLKWSFDKVDRTTVIFIPENLQNESNRPCKYAYTFRIEI